MTGLSQGSLALLAFDKYAETEEAKTLAKRFGSMLELFPIFEAGWNAARAEARSDASQPAPYQDKNEDGSPIMVGDRQKYTRRRLDADGNWQPIEPPHPNDTDVNR